MMIDEKDLKKTLEELYDWHYRQAKNRNQSDYQLGKCDGAVETLGVIYFGLYGGKEMMKLWGNNLDDTTTGG